MRNFNIEFEAALRGVLDDPYDGAEAFHEGAATQDWSAVREHFGAIINRIDADLQAAGLGREAAVVVMTARSAISGADAEGGETAKAYALAAALARLAKLSLDAQPAGTSAGV